MAAFRFSPRPNRANEIPWQAWGSQAFTRARREEKPILLSISAVWCHWCHVMDETTYSDPAVIASIADHFVPIRVDTDERPDINARYNMGGWPTTAFLTADGTSLTGATYVPPPQMRRILEEVARWYRDNAAEISQRAAEIRTRRAPHAVGTRDDLSAESVRMVASAIGRTFDEEYAGFGDAPKFPQPELLEFLWTEGEATGEVRLREMVERTLVAMTSGGMYDHVEGGFFRYSTTRDWSVPHFEKMAEDNAGLIRVLSLVVANAPHHELRERLRSSVEYVLHVLFDPASGAFAGSQDADEEYYALPLAQRQARSAPFVDRTLYADRNAALAGALCFAGAALANDALIARGIETLDMLHEQMLDDDGLLVHMHREGDRRVGGLLIDQASYLRALLDTYDVAGCARFHDRADALIGAMQRRLASPDGGFYDRAPTEEQFGRLALQDRPFVENAIVAESLLRFPEERYRALAERTLLVYAKTFAHAGAFAAAYARALRRYLSGPHDGRTKAFQYQAPQKPASIE